MKLQLKRNPAASANAGIPSGDSATNLSAGYRDLTSVSHHPGRAAVLRLRRLFLAIQLYRLTSSSAAQEIIPTTQPKRHRRFPLPPPDPGTTTASILTDIETIGPFLILRAIRWTLRRLPCHRDHQSDQLLRQFHLHPYRAMNRLFRLLLPLRHPQSQKLQTLLSGLVCFLNSFHRPDWLAKIPLRQHLLGPLPRPCHDNLIQFAVLPSVFSSLCWTASCS